MNNPVPNLAQFAERGLSEPQVSLINRVQRGLEALVPPPEYPDAKGYGDLQILPRNQFEAAMYEAAMTPNHGVLAAIAEIALEKSFDEGLDPKERLFWKENGISALLGLPQLSD
jgi:hypothetical protein